MIPRCRSSLQVAFLIVALRLAVFSHAGAADWHLAASTGARAPVGIHQPAPRTPPTSPEESMVITHGPRGKKQLALTFDADMTPRMLRELREGKVTRWYDPAIVTTLLENAIPATIFITGLWAETYPSVVRQLAGSRLFEIENHGFSHSAFRTPCYHLPSATDKKAEIVDTQKILRGLTGQTPRYFRFPGGCASPSDARLVRSLGLQPVGWDVSSGDAFSANEKGIVREVLERTQGGSIVVMHLSDGPNAPKTALALLSVIQGLRKRGFAFASVSQLIVRP